MNKTTIIASDASWIEGEAVRQLEQTAALPGMIHAYGQPDLHPGRGTPVGAAFLSQNLVYPHLVGNDIGCGMSLWETTLKKGKPAKWASRLDALDQPFEGDATPFLQAHGLEPDGDTALGTVGGGNHFAELQRVTAMEEVGPLRLNPKRLYLLVHSGSRGLGQAILQDQVARTGARGIEGEEAKAYLALHDRAVAWARANRDLIAWRFLSSLGAQGTRLLDVCHNNVVPKVQDGKTLMLHRKGAAPADKGPVVVPGSRGSRSYLVTPQPDCACSGWSLAHGAGRKWNRHEAKKRMKGRFKPDDLKRTKMGSLVICDDRNLLYEEAPEAYKNVDRVVADLCDHDLARVSGILEPVLTFKTRRRR